MESELIKTIEAMNNRLINVEKLGAGLTLEVTLWPSSRHICYAYPTCYQLGVVMTLSLRVSQGKMQYELVNDANSKAASIEARVLSGLEACTERISTLEKQAHHRLVIRSRVFEPSVKDCVPYGR